MAISCKTYWWMCLTTSYSLSLLVTPVNTVILFFKVWNLANCKLKTNHLGHHGYLNTVTVSPDGSLCASGGRVWKIYLFFFHSKFSCIVKLLVCSNDDISKDILLMIKRLFLIAASINQLLELIFFFFFKDCCSTHLCYWIVKQIWFS